MSGILLGILYSILILLIPIFSYVSFVYKELGRNEVYREQLKKSRHDIKYHQ